MTKTKKMVCIAMLCALAYVIVFVAKLVPIGVLSFLKYDPKDVVIAIGGFIFGPLSAFVISVIVSLAELFTISGTGPIGFLMNVISSCSFACVAAAIYKNNRTQKYAVIGLIVGSIASTASMLVWNYLITPLYMETPRTEIVKMLLPIFLPFNLIKTALNSSITLLIYKPFVRMLRKIGIVNKTGEKQSVINIKMLVAALFTVLMCVFAIIILN